MNQAIHRSSTCPHCASDLKICRNCRHYDASRRFECKEDLPEDVREKERANYCDLFQARDEGGAPVPEEIAPAEKLRRQAEALFKKG